MKVIEITYDDDRLTTEILQKWVDEAVNSIAVKVMVGNLDPKLEPELVAVMQILKNGKIIVVSKDDALVETKKRMS